MIRVRALAALLAYPEEELIASLPQLESLFSGDRELEKFLREMQEGGLAALQERYVELFDRSRALSLHLFEHVHGESRDRGQAMVDLAQTYSARGFEVAAGELPDYLPAFLEFVSTLEAAEGRNVLGETADILRSLGDRLAERGSRYAAVFAALLAAAGESGLTKRISAAAPPREDLAALDKEWAEEPVTFMGAQAPQPVKFYPKGAVS